MKKVFDVGDYYAKILEAKVLKIGENTPNNTVVIFSKSLDSVLEKYGSLKAFWNFVMKQTEVEMALLALHCNMENVEKAELHLLLKFDKVICKEELAELLGEIHMNKTGKIEFKTDSMHFLKSNMFDSYHLEMDYYARRREGSFFYVVEITPAFSEYLVKYEHLMVYTLYKDFLRKEKKRMKKDSELEGNSVAELIETETVEIDDLDVTADFSTDEIADTAQSGKSLRGRIMMYTQRVDRIINNCGSLANFEDCIRTTVCDVTKGDHYAIILHDKDKSSVAGKAFADPHIHVAFEFQNARHAIAIVKVLNDFRDDGSPNVQAITIFKGNVGNLYSYLCHRTKKSSHKYQYDPSVVKASFDYVKKLENITAQVNTAKQVKEASSKLNMVLEELRSRNITLQDIEKTLPASVYARNVNNIRNVWSLAMKLEAQEWRERKIRSGERTNVIWIWGKSATGKSSFGRDYVSKDGKEHYIAGSSSAMWDGYESYMHLALLDECRPDMFKTYRDMLSILDNYQSRAVAPARYYDRELALDTIVITTVYSPYEFYKHMDIKDSTVDEFYQLERRITECIHMDDYFMMNSYFNPVERRYEVDVDSLVCNPYSEVRRGTKKEKHDRSTYSSIVHSAPMVSAHDEILNENYDDEDNMTDDELISDELYSDELLYDDYTDEDMSLVEVIAQLEELEDFYDDSDFDEGGEEENE